MLLFGTNSKLLPLSLSSHILYLRPFCVVERSFPLILRTVKHAGRRCFEYADGCPNTMKIHGNFRTCLTDLKHGIRKAYQVRYWFYKFLSPAKSFSSYDNEWLIQLMTFPAMLLFGLYRWKVLEPDVWSQMAYWHFCSMKQEYHYHHLTLPNKVRFFHIDDAIILL